MSDLVHIQRAVNTACRFIQATWQQAVMGAQQVQGVPEIRANINLRRIYSDSIVMGEQLNIPDAGILRGQVIATKQIARDLEYGKPKWDMKPMLLGGPKARVSKAGYKYNIIPFRHATPGGNTNSAVGRPMPKDIYAEARKLKASIRDGNRIAWGEKLTGTEGRYAPGKNRSTGYQHKNGKCEGMVRVEKEYARATQSKYLTFRVVSEKSDPKSWWHPGYQPHYIARGVAAYCEPHVREMIMAAAQRDLEITLGAK